MKLLTLLFINTFAIFAASYVIPGFTITNLQTAIISAIVIGTINLLIRPLMLIITLPINILTLGLFTFVINGLMLYFASSFVSGFHIDSLFSAILASIFITILKSFIKESPSR